MHLFLPSIFCVLPIFRFGRRFLCSYFVVDLNMQHPKQKVHIHEPRMNNNHKMMFVGFYLAREHTHDNNQNASSMRDRIHRRSGLSKFSVCTLFLRAFYAPAAWKTNRKQNEKCKEPHGKFSVVKTFFFLRIRAMQVVRFLWSAKLSVITSQQVIRVEYAMPKSWAILFHLDRMIVPHAPFHRFQNFFTISLSARCGEMIRSFFFAPIVFERKKRIINYRVQCAVIWRLSNEPY